MRDWKSRSPATTHRAPRRSNPPRIGARRTVQHLEDPYRSLLAQGIDTADAEASVLRELDDDETLRSATRAVDPLTHELRHLERRYSQAAVPGRPARLAIAATWGARSALCRPRPAQEPGLHGHCRPHAGARRRRQHRDLLRRQRRDAADRCRSPRPSASSALKQSRTRLARSSPPPIQTFSTGGRRPHPGRRSPQPPAAPHPSPGTPAPKSCARCASRRSS